MYKVCHKTLEDKIFIIQIYCFWLDQYQEKIKVLIVLKHGVEEGNTAPMCNWPISLQVWIEIKSICYTDQISNFK